MSCMQLSSLIIQGIDACASPLTQLPHINNDRVTIFQKRRKSLNTVQSFVQLNEKDKEYFLQINKGICSRV
ncbi:hypothetical protein HZS_2993 [Henneguya salminicola]|nr:hypothetical protein HZS_2993 [Henneguya salminicola]